MEEKRGLERLPLKSAIRIRTENGKTQSFHARLDDLSFGGLGLHLDRMLTPEKAVEFELLSDYLDKPLLGRGRVRHIKRDAPILSSFKVGIEFTDVERAQLRQIIDRVLRSRRNKPGFLAQHKKGFLITLPLSLAAVTLTFAILFSVNSLEASGKKEQEYTEKYRQALVYYLFNEPRK